MSEVFIDVWVQKSKNYQAAQITEENIQAVAKWCGGRIFGVQDLEGPMRSYIKVPVMDGTRIRAVKAWVGDWVVWSEEEEFQHYHRTAFPEDFVKKISRRKDIYDLLMDFVQEHTEYNSSHCGRLAKNLTEKLIRIEEGQDVWATN